MSTRIERLRARLNWLPYGFNVDEDTSNVTYPSAEEIKIEIPQAQTKKEDRVEKQMAVRDSTVKCRICGGAHWSKECPNRHLMEQQTEKAPIAKIHTESDELPSLHVSNLSPDVDDQDLRDLFQMCGRVQSVYVVKDRETGNSRGFAYVRFYDRGEAEAAIEKLNHHRYDSMVINVRWATSNKKTGGGASTDRPRFRSGYGKALPQSRT